MPRQAFDQVEARSKAPDRHWIVAGKSSIIRANREYDDGTGPSRPPRTENRGKSGRRGSLQLYRPADTPHLWAAKTGRLFCECAPTPCPSDQRYPRSVWWPSYGRNVHGIGTCRRT